MYKSIFEKKLNKEHKREFCQRVVNLLHETILYYEYEYYRGEDLINLLFKKSKLNNGFYSVDDLLEENGLKSIWTLQSMSSDAIHEEDILANTEILLNCFLELNKTYFDFNDDNVTIAKKAMENYLLSIGYKSIIESGVIRIVENNMAIDVDNIADIQLRDDVITYYDYKNVFNKVEKRRIIVDLINILEPKKDLIKKILGNKVEDLYGFYANNIQLRHNNTDPAVKSHYNKSIADLNDEELVKWYDFIFAFNFNIYVNINKLKNININEGCK